MLRHLSPVFLTVVFLIASCSRSVPDNRIEEARSILPDYPERAVELLSGLSPDSLSPYERAEYGLVLSKALILTGDSLPCDTLLDYAACYFRAMNLPLKEAEISEVQSHKYLRERQYICALESALQALILYNRQNTGFKADSLILMSCDSLTASQAWPVIHNSFVQELAQRRDQASRDQKDLTICGLSILVIILLISPVFIRKFRSDKRDKEIYLLERDILCHRISDLSASRNLLPVIKSRTTAIDNLCERYFEKGYSDRLKHTLITDLEKEIAALTSSDSLLQLENDINLSYNNIISRIKNQLPQLKEKDLVFILFVLAGFSPRSISLFLNIKLGNYYNRWTRLRKKIASSDAPDKKEFITAIFS